MTSSTLQFTHPPLTRQNSTQTYKGGYTVTTTSSGGKITGLLALTMATDVALQVGDYVHIVGDYKVGLANGTKAILGEVSVRSVKRTSTATSETFPVVGTTGSQVTVEARGFS